MSRTALIVGSGGQDGSLLTQNLTRHGYCVVGVRRDSVVSTALNTEFPAVDIRDSGAVETLVRRTMPDKIYFLAAHHHAAQEKTEDDATLFRLSHDIHVGAFINFLEAARRHAAAARIFYAASSHVFGSPECDEQDENTPMRPVSPYGVTKAAGLSVCNYYREMRGLFVTGGILYNHESPLRSPQFISRKLARAAALAKAGDNGSVTVGNLEATADWGWAEDFVEAMRLMLDLEEPGTFVVATGQRHTVRDMAEAAFSAVGLDYRAFVGMDSGVLHRNTSRLKGNPAKLCRKTGWAPTLAFPQMIAELVRAELDRH